MIMVYKTWKIYTDSLITCQTRKMRPLSIYFFQREITVLKIISIRSDSKLICLHVHVIFLLTDFINLVKDIRSDVRNASMAGSGFTVYMGEKPTNITSTNLGSGITKNLTVESRKVSSSTHTISKMSVISDNLFIGLKERGSVLVYDNRAGHVMKEIQHDEVCGGIWSMDVSQDGSTVALAASSGAISIHDMRKCTQPLYTTFSDTHSEVHEIPEVHISPTGSYLSLSGSGKCVQILDYKKFEGESKYSFVHDGHRGARVNRVVAHLWHPVQQQLLFSADDNSNIQAWKFL